MSDLTTADAFDLLEATKNGREKNYQINRWSKKGDRLYLDDDAKLDKHGVYVDLEAGTVEGTPSSSWSTDVTVESNTLTVTVERGKVRTKTSTFVIEIEGDEFEDADEDEPEVACDGGEDVTAHIADEDIEAAIEANDDPEHPDAWTVEEVRDALAAIQTDHVDYLQEFFDAHTLVHADEELYVFADDSGQVISDSLHAANVDPKSDDASILHSIVSQVYHETADRVTDRSWPTAVPIAIGRAGPEAALSREEETLSDDAVVRSLVAHGLSAAEALDYYLVEVRDLPMVQVATERGTTHQAVSKNVRQARDKLA